MKILIIGGNSSIGKALKPILTQFAEVITAGRGNCDVHLDLNDPVEKIVLPTGVDAVIHLAAHFGGETAQEMIEAETVNVLGTIKVCQAAVQSKTKHFILLSSMFACLDDKSKYYTTYALTKKHSEQVARFFCSKHSLALTVLRPSQVYGPTDEFRKHQPFFYTIMDKAQNNEDIPLFGSYDARKNYIYIDDLTSVIAKVVEYKIEGTYSCMFPDDITYSQISNAALKAFNSKKCVVRITDKPDIADNIFEKDNTLFEKIGFYPRVSIEEGTGKIAYYRKENT